MITNVPETDESLQHLKQVSRIKHIILQKYLPSWERIILKRSQTEALINFMYYRINMDAGNEKVQHHLDEMFGNGEWRTQAFLKESGWRREQGFLEYFMSKINARYKLPFRIRFDIEDGVPRKRTKYYLEKVPFAFVQRVFQTMGKALWHTFQILTKRSERLVELAPDLSWPPNAWMGVSIETAKYLWRADHLRDVPAAVRFLSLEPLLGPLGTLDLSGIHWVIVGGESGPGARPIEADWVREIRKQCRQQDVPFFFKQWGGVQKKRNGRVLDGRTWDGMPRGHLLEA